MKINKSLIGSHCTSFYLFNLGGDKYKLVSGAEKFIEVQTEQLIRFIIGSRNEEQITFSEFIFVFFNSQC